MKETPHTRIHRKGDQQIQLQHTLLNLRLKELLSLSQTIEAKESVSLLQSLLLQHKHTALVHLLNVRLLILLILIQLDQQRIAKQSSSQPS